MGDTSEHCLASQDPRGQQLERAGQAHLAQKLTVGDFPVKNLLFYSTAH